MSFLRFGLKFRIYTPFLTHYRQFVVGVEVPFKSFSYLKVLLEAVKPVLDEEQLQDAVESLLMEGSAYDAKLLYSAMKVKRSYGFLFYF